MLRTPFRLIRASLFAALTALLIGLIPPAYAISCSTAALIVAITNANASAADDTISLSPGCTYTLTSVNDTTNGASGLPAIVSTATGGKLTIEGNGATIARSSAGGTPAF